MKIYVTKYALTNGIKVLDAVELYHTGMVMVEPKEKGVGLLTQYFHKGDWAATPEKALAKAEEMRIAKLKSLDRQMKKISAITFTITDQK